MGADALSPDARIVFDEAPCGLVRTDEKGLILRANVTFCRWLGVKEGALVGLRRFHELLTMGGRIFHQTHWGPLLQLQGSVAEVKVELVCPDARRLPVILNAVRRSASDRVVHDLALYVALDRDKYERELVASRNALERLVAETERLHDEAKVRASFAEQMVGIVSHDLRNPLSTVQLGAALLPHDGLTPAQRKTVDRMVRATDRAQRLIADLLDFTRARLGDGLGVARAPVDLHRVVGQAIEELSLAFPGRALRHVSEGDGEATLDADRVAQLVGNLVANAMAYGEPSGTVTVTSCGEATSCSLSVHNLGPPITSELLPRLFAPMTRGAPESPSVRSVGLGLFIVRAIALAHGGSVEVVSKEGEGTTFTVRLPRTIDGSA